MHICTDGDTSKPCDDLEGKRVSHGVCGYLGNGSGMGSKTKLTNVEVWNKPRHGLPRKVHGAQALPKERESRPRGVLYKPPRFEEDKVQVVRC